MTLLAAGHRYSDVDLDDPNFERAAYDPWVGYGRSKTANVLFAVEFDRRHKTSGVAATAVHPGGIQTELSRHLTPEMTRALIERINAANKASGEPDFSFKSIPQGAATSVWAGVVATADQVGGRYCENCHVCEVIFDDQNIDMATEGVRRY